MSNLINNIDELDKLSEDKYQIITKISFNNLSKVNFDKLKNITKLCNLTELDLTRNSEFFTAIDDKVYQNLIQLYDTLEKSNILSDEFLKHRETFICAANKCLIDITKPIKEQLTNNKIIQKYKQLIFTNQTIKILNLSHNSLSTLPLDICKLKNIINLDLSYNQLSTLPIDIGKLVNIINLDLSYNQLTTLPLNICKLKNIINFNLSHNQLFELPKEIGKLVNITNLSCNINIDIYDEFFDIDIDDHNNDGEIEERLGLDFDYCASIQERYENECEYYATNPDDVTIYSWDDYWKIYENDDDTKAEEWESFIYKNKNEIEDAIKEYNKNMFLENQDKIPFNLKNISQDIFILSNINTISFSSKGEYINNILKNIIDEIPTELDDFLEELDNRIPYNITMTKSDDEWNIKIKQIITNNSIELTINMTD